MTTVRVSSLVRRLALVAVVLATFGCDRVTKQVATERLAGEPGRSYLGDTVRLSYAENPGGFLSLGASLPEEIRTAVFTSATGVMLLVLVFVAVRREWEPWPALGIALFLAGGLSNWIDRLVDGHVVDFLNVGFGSLRTGIFNVADVAIMAGALVVVVKTWRQRPATEIPPAP